MIYRSKLHDLFHQIEKEFEVLYAENATCKSTLKIIIFLFIRYASFTNLLLIFSTRKNRCIKRKN